MTNDNDPGSTWAAALERLKTTQSKTLYDQRLACTRLVEAHNGTYIIDAGSELNRDWLQHRLNPILQRNVSAIAGRPITLKFVVDNQARQQEPEPAEAPQPQFSPRGGELEGGEVVDFTTLDYRQLWKKTGFVMVPDYASNFWQPLLGSRAYALWLYIQARNKTRDLWTRPRRLSISQLARSLKVSRSSITGCLRPCAFAERQKLIQEPLHKCCRRYCPVDWDYITQTGDQQCMHWNPGAFEDLYQAHLLGIKTAANNIKDPRGRKVTLQVWTVLPLLTPVQLDQLTEAHQIEHERWLERYGHLAGSRPGGADVDLAAWEQLTAPSLVPLLPGHDSQELTDVYQPNPLLDDDHDQLDNS